MCGILCLISDSCKETPLQQLYNDCKKQIKRRGPNGQHSTQFCINNKTIQMYAGVLWLQGDTMVEQPINTPNSLFSYNGDIFGGSAISQENALGDTHLFLERLEAHDHTIIHSLANLYGPYAFIYYDKTNSNLYFGRDAFGRRSLLLTVDKENDAVLITSVAVRSSIHMIEVPAIGIFSCNLNCDNIYYLEAWPKKHKNFDEKLSSVHDLLGCHVTIHHSSNMKINTFVMPKSEKLLIFEEIKHFSIEQAFECLLNNSKWKENVIQLHNKLENALRTRINTQPKYCKDCISTKKSCKHCCVGILFSGGIDCTVLAVLADKFIEHHTPIDLLNVAFSETGDYNTPDRLTGLQSLAELQHLRPHRHWNFVSIDVPKAELDEARRTQIANLIYPLNTVLDDSLGCALWFASRGKSECYESPCRVLLVGMGADELFGGYTRHRAALKSRGWIGLHDVLEEDWANIAHRNLARDDRVVADHGRQLRTPYLDEEVVDFVQSLQVWEKTYPASDLPQGLGEKILLRTLAYYLGLRCASSFRKRALQFGSRIANKKENAHEVSPRLVF